MEACDAVIERATQTRRWAQQNSVSLLDIALQHLTLGRAGLYRAILDGAEISNFKSQIQDHLDAALTGLRRNPELADAQAASEANAVIKVSAGDEDG